MNYSYTWRLGVTLVGVLVLSACASVPVIQKVVPTAAFLMNDDVVISSEDGSWSFRSGEPFIPFDVSSWAYSAAYLAAGGDALTAYADQLDQVAFQKVQITKNGYEKPFYGVLVFSQVLETGDALAKRRWQVGIPEQYFRSALNGGVSVVFGPYGFQRYYDSGWGYELGDSKTKGTSWVLWMSDLPLW